MGGVRSEPLQFPERDTGLVNALKAEREERRIFYPVRSARFRMNVASHQPSNNKKANPRIDHR